jgi:hypothetical protein
MNDETKTETMAPEHVALVKAAHERRLKASADLKNANAAYQFATEYVWPMYGMQPQDEVDLDTGEIVRK